MAQITNAYQDFVPTTEWVRDPEFDTLLLYLPGFKKEKLKVQVTSSSNLRISGERSLGENKWSRFHKELLIPSNYVINKISANYEGGILRIKHPKITRTQAKLSEETADDQLQALQNERDRRGPEVPPKAKTGTTDAANANAASQNKPDKEKKETDAEGKNTEAANIPGKISGLVGSEKMTSLDGNNDMIQEATGALKSKLGYCKQVFGGLVTEMKKPKRKTTNLIVAAGLLVVVLGLYVNRAIRSEESNN